MSRTPLPVALVTLGSIVALVGACSGGVVEAHCVNDLCVQGTPGDASVDGGADVATGPDAHADVAVTCGSGVCPADNYSCSPSACSTCVCSLGTGWSCDNLLCIDAGVDTGAVCPTGTPLVGDPCNPAVGTCSYANSCSGQTTFTCDGKWVLGTRSCAATCPATEPASGSTCALSSGTTCKFTNACGTTDAATCLGGLWQLTAGKCGPTCPPIEPLGSEPCGTNGQVCSYADSCGSKDVATCNGGLWSLTPGDCTPPACPTAEPNGGAACTAVMKCSWTSFCGATDYGACEPNSTGALKWQLTYGKCP